MKYNETSIQTYARSSVTDVLEYFGKDNRVNRSGFIISPFRDESTPSFHITPSGRGWKDFGDGTGGGVIDLVMRLSGKDREGAIRILREMEGSGFVCSSFAERNPPRSRIKEPSFEIYSKSQLCSLKLLSYSRSRGISDEVLKKYCLEVTVTYRKQKTQFSRYIGFRNDLGGFVLRSEKPADRGKRCTSSAPTSINEEGIFTTEPASDSVAVFEGFFDFLSFIQIYHPDTLAPGCDVCVLNSITNREKASRFLLSHNQVFLFLDNDPAGRETSAAILSDAASDGRPHRVLDRSEAYAGFKDLNEFLVRQKEHGQEHDNIKPFKTKNYGDTGNECGEEGDQLP